MSNLKQDLDRIRERISDPSFLKNEGLCNEVGIHIQDVDHCTVISSHVIDSPILGAITPRELSGGVKVLILMLKDDSFIYNMSGIIGFPTTIFVDNAGNIVGDPIVGSDIAATEEYIKSMNKE